MKNKNLSFLLIILFIQSCSSISYEFNPYRNGDLLIFKDIHNNLDTVEILTTEIYTNGVDPLSTSVYGQTLIVTANYSSPKFGSDEKIVGEYFSINKPSDYIYFHFKFQLKQAKFYGNSLKFTEYRALKKLNFLSRGYTFKDVVKIESDNNEYAKEKNFINYLYWSKEWGYVKAVLADNEWVLIKRIRKNNSNR